MLLTNTSKAQFSSSDSSFLSTVFTEVPYQNDSLFPGDWYYYSDFNSIASFYGKLDAMFKFNGNEWANAYQQMELLEFRYDSLRNATFNYYYNVWGNAYQQLDPLVIQSFLLNGKTQEAFSTLTPANTVTDCKTGFLIIPGSDNNQTTDIVLGYGYHNNNCFVKNTLKQYGDVYVYCKPLEDYRALRWGGLKLNSGDYVTPGAASFVYNYLNASHRPYAVNYLIECVALLKMMRSKYDKVVVVGCSLGGYSALLAGLETPVDGVICASGYSIYFDSLASVQYELSQNFENLNYQYPANLIASKIFQQPSKQFLFSYANLDNSLYQEEHDSLYTQTFLSSNPNCSFYTNFNTHSFPPCIVLENFSDSIQLKRSVHFRKLSEDNLICHTKVNICPGTNLNFYLVRNGAIVNSFFNVQDSVLIDLMMPGTYYLTGITSGGSVLSCLDTLIYTVQLPTGVSQNMNTKTDIVVTNPAHNFMQCVSSSTEPIEVVLYNLSGQELLHQRVMSNEKLPTMAWQSGLYLLELRQGESIQHVKLIIQHEF